MELNDCRVRNGSRLARAGASALHELLARRKPAQVGHGYAEVVIGVDWGVVDADFVVEVGAGGASALADEADGVGAAGEDGKFPNFRRVIPAGSSLSK